MKKASMQDIADALGISKNSVSQALRNMPGVSQQTRMLVKNKADELGYHYKKASSLSEDKRFLLMATEFAFSQISFFGEIIKSIETAAHNAGYQIERHTITEKELQTSVPPDVNEYNGIFILSHSKNALIKRMIQTGIPVVLVDHHHPDLMADAILSKNTDGTFQAISLLIQNGLTRIGFIGDIDFSPSYLERYRGYHRALCENEISLDSAIEITQIEESQGALFERLKKIEQMPEAWFCVNSGLAFMLNSYLQSAGFIIPDDISILCFDETEFTRMAVPQITNIATNLDYMGKLAVKTLLNRINAPEEPLTHYQIVPQLNIHDSVKLKKE